MITFEDYKNSKFYNEERFQYAKAYYMHVLSKKIKKIEKLFTDNANLFDCCCCWVTDFGAINGTETDNDDLINIFTYNGMCMDSDLGYLPCIDFGFSKEVKDTENSTLHKMLLDIIESDFYDIDYQDKEYGWYRLESGDLDEYYNILNNAIELIKKTMNKDKKYMWVASSDDGAYNETSNAFFNTKEECYNDMRNAVLEKMKWNTNYSEDFECHRNEKGECIPYETDDNYIGYEVLFHPTEIVHKSYSGKYTYKIVEKSVQSAPRIILDGLIKGDDKETIADAEKELISVIQNAIDDWKNKTYSVEVKSLSIQPIQHLCID